MFSRDASKDQSSPLPMFMLGVILLNVAPSGVWHWVGVIAAIVFGLMWVVIVIATTVTSVFKFRSERASVT